MNSLVNHPMGGFNKEKLQSLVQRVRYLQSQGAKEDNNPEYAQIMSFLKNLQNSQQQRQQLQQMRPGMNIDQVASSNPSSTIASPITSGHDMPTAFTQTQLAALRHQILAYKLISKNMALPPHLQQAVLTPTTALSMEGMIPVGQPPSSLNVNPITTNNIDHAQTSGVSNAAAAVAGNRIGNSTISTTVTTTAAGTPSQSSSAPSGQINTTINNNNNNNNQQKIEYNAYASPYDLLKKPINAFTHASRQQHLLIPSITPIGLDPCSIISERKRRMLNRIQHRIQELENLPSNLNDSVNRLEEEIRKPTGTIKLKAIIELKALRLLNKQRQLREEIVAGLKRSTTLATSADRLAYRRMKKQSLREARMTEKIERQQRTDREHREKQKHLDYLQTICDHGRSLVAAQANWRSKQNKLGRAVLQYHQHIEKEEQKRAERISKERIRALKNDDEEAYMKLIDEAKDTRLTQLLKQTGAFLDSLTQAVKEQQNDHRQDRSFSLDNDDDDDDMAANDPDAKNDYFQVTHRIKEEVTQPDILVGGRLKDYQLKGLQWMVSLYNNHLNGILADEMGLGKTIQTISLITYLIEKKRQNGPYLIIVPLSTLTNWTLEFEKWAPSVKTIVYKGPPNTRKELQNEIRYNDFQVLLTTFEYIIKDRPVLSKVKWLHMVVDEGHRMKNTNSKLTVVLRQYYHTRYRLILTGTPLQNNLPELWALLNFILPKIFKSVKSFEEWFNTPFNNQGVADKIGLNEEEQLLIIKRLHKVLRPFLLRRLKRDVEAELPDKVERVIKCKLSPLQVHLYTQMKRNGTLYTSDVVKGKTGVKGLNNTIMQLRKICNHPFVFEEVESVVNPSGLSNELLYRTSGKFELLDRMLPKLKETGHRVLIFFQMTQVMSIMEDFLNWKGFSYLRLDGSTKADDRSELLRLFNAEDSPYFVFLLSTRAGGLGLNLQTADTVIIFDSDWNPHQDLQAQDRAHRIGQTKEVRIFRLISTNSVEENILARANFKLDIDGKVIQAGKFDNRSTEEDREAFLRSLLEDKADEDNDGDDEDIDDEELNEMLQRSEADLEVFHRLDDEREENDKRLWQVLGRRGKPERLITEDELPDIYLNDDPLPTQDEDQHHFGRGQRARETVRYDDGLTEEQWLNALEDENVDLEELIAKKEKRRQKRMARLLGEPEPMIDEPKRLGRRRREESVSVASEEPVSRKRGRPKKSELDKRKRGRNDTELNKPDTLPTHIRESLTKVFKACYQAVEEATVEDEETYRSRSELFMDLVSKRDYPLYYTMIKNPISMNMIKKRIHSTFYKNIAQFRDDFHLMFNNARIFNEEGSFVYEDANEMQKIFDAKLEELCPGGVLPITPTSIHFNNNNNINSHYNNNVSSSHGNATSIS
ncbi:SNF2 family N-terminal domain-containing protein [Cokeromyces recurvatus]|uniref:SNF2 family N-terminal domain-containing protein n=1 Tax=Cokeromyces recurvatus TaxID=90255 RepID=UPI00221EEAAB|nr:SNF2 family N-terminal domain-containing protein [Cokeromyces recurvatus]KAI7907267.1 SNF2 family N-terminal domain-containing protein [Cokeromyces recurvatus]